MLHLIDIMMKMNVMYILWVLLIAFVLYKKIPQIITDIKTGDKSKLKADVFMLILSLIVAGLVFWLISTM